jgi:hypothetical protein
MLLRSYVKRCCKLSGVVEVDEVYVNAGLKRSNHSRIVLLGRRPIVRV